MKSLVKVWLETVPWDTVVSINASLCKGGHATHKPTSDGYESAKKLWGENRSKEMSLQELLQLCFRCHRLAPFCFYNGNTFVTVVKTLLTEPTRKMPAEKSHLLHSIAGHIVAGTATDIEVKQLNALLKELTR